MRKLRAIASALEGRQMAILLPTSMVLLGGSFSTMAAGQITNAITAFPITVDGVFTNAQEWSDVTPAAFISTPRGTTPTTPGNPAANSFLYAVVGQDGPDEDLYLMYDDVGFTSPLPSNTLVSDVSFPVDVSPNGPRDIIDVQGITGSSPTTPGSFNVIDKTTNQTLSADSLGIEGAIGFAGSPNGSTPHLMVELEVPLLIPANFGPGFPGGEDGGPDGGGYSPNPAYWQANTDTTGNGPGQGPVDPPISAGIFTINPDGSLLVEPVAVAVPEPSSLGLLGLVGAMFLRRRRTD